MFQIMVVDDDRNTRRLLQAVLEADGYKVLTAENGEDALALMDSEYVDLVVLDIMMPKVDGLTVLRTLDGKVPASRLSGYGEDNRITNVTLRNVTILGEKMTNLKQMKLRYDDYCEGIVVE